MTGMFDPSRFPRVFGVPLGADFPRALVDGLIGEYRDQPPEALARTHLIVNTRRMARRIRALFDDGPACLLPRISLLTDFGEQLGLAHIPDPVPPLRRRLELLRLVAALLDTQPDLAPRSALYDLADSLAGLMDEMHGEGVPPEALEALDITDQSGHWERVKAFLGIIRDYFDPNSPEPDVETRQRMVIEFYTRLWQEAPPDHPVIVAGSTGSRGATQLLMQTVARLPQGAVVLPGFDFDMPRAVWETLSDPATAEDHPQFRFAHFMGKLGGHPDDVIPWPGAAPANPARNRLLSLALRPAPVTDQWLTDGPNLIEDLSPATERITLVEAPSARAEALTIAMRLRQAAEERQTAALITPDRTLTRRVAAALDRWNILPDDSAGTPLHLTAPGRFLRHVADLFRNRLSTEMLLTILKHPLTHSGAETGRGPHLRLTRELELHLRRHGPPYPASEDIRAWAAGISDDHAGPWVDWLCTCLTGQGDPGTRPLDDRVAHHIALAEQVAAGPKGDPARLWSHEDGRKARETVSDLAEHAAFSGDLNATDYSNLFHSILSGQEVRDPDAPHSGILIWGTLEARVQGADLLILAGLNEGTWPEAPRPDPWLNRALRGRAGLLLPERRIGLSAHDFQQAALAPEVWFTRSIRSDGAQTVPSRWLNRLQNLLGGLPGAAGKQALAAMRSRGDTWLALARGFETPGRADPAPRPAPCPPVAARPKQLSVTEIRALIRDPYAIYARHVLNLRPLDPLMRTPDALVRGIALHDVLERVIRDTRENPALLTRDRLLAETVSVLAQSVPWGAARAMWQARMERVADHFVEGEMGRRALADPAAFEVRSAADLPDLGFTLTAKADRVDIDRSGAYHIYDYKTGAPPTTAQQRAFNKQLLLEAALAEISGFGDLPPARVARAVYVGLGSAPKDADAPLEEEPVAEVWAKLRQLIAAYMTRERGYPSRRAVMKKDFPGDYDHLARFGEWDITDDPAQGEVGK